jgi:hypothetical protein
VLFERVKRRDSRVLDGGERPGLSLQPFQSRPVVRERLGKDLEGDVATETMIPGAIDLPHPPHSQQRDNFVVSESNARAQCHVCRR